MNLPVRRGSHHPLARFTPEEVQAIRQQFDAHPVSYRVMAEHWCCSLHTIFRIVNRLTYRDE